jgi:OOP family OmpA-OmpF porin
VKNPLTRRSGAIKTIRLDLPFDLYAPMMMKLDMRRWNILVSLLMLALMAAGGCQASRQAPPFYPVYLDPDVFEGRIVPKIDGFLLVVDSSESMAQRYREIPRIDQAIRFLDHFNRSLPRIAVSAGMRVMGASGEPLGLTSRRIYGVSEYRQDELDAAIQMISKTGGHSPLAEAMTAAGEDLSGMSGNMALILVTDGDALGPPAVDASQALKARYGDRLCIHTVQIGDLADSESLLGQIVAAGECGVGINADWVLHPVDMADYVKHIFYAKRPAAYDRDRDGVPDGVDACPWSPIGAQVDDTGCPVDTDGDGVPDPADRCPGTPSWVTADAEGCPPDSDGDGINDDMDQCPVTPRGAVVDGRGCWVLNDVQFDTGDAAIKPEFARRLDVVVAVLKENPLLDVEVQGHTDDTGPAAVNQVLSQARAKAVVAYLVSQGVDADRLSAKGMGATRPLAVNDTPEGRAMNRRVEIIPRR